MFDRMVDVVTAAANLARFREPGRQFETCLPQVEPAELGRAAPAPLHEVAAPLEIRNEAFLAKKLQSYGGRDAAGLKGSRHTGFAQYQTVDQRAAFSGDPGERNCIRYALALCFSSSMRRPVRAPRSHRAQGGI